MTNQSQNIVLQLLKVALGNATAVSLPTDVNWAEVIEVATNQGVLGVCFDAFDKLPDTCRPDIDNLMEWLGQVEYQTTLYAEHKKAIASLAEFYKEQDIRMMLLKGYGLSKCWPVPNHRPTGDIDCFLFQKVSGGSFSAEAMKAAKPSVKFQGVWQEADQLLTEKLGIEIDNSHHHHSVFNYLGVTVENHFDFINTKDHPSSKIWEMEFKRLAHEEEPLADGEIGNLYYPSANLNALFLLKHAALHFASTELILRQVLDWLLFVASPCFDKLNTGETSPEVGGGIDWNRIYDFLREQNLDRFADVLNAIGVRYLGFEESLFPSVSSDEALVERVMNDILSPEFEEKEDGTLLSGLWVKPRRFWHNRWKHELCYKDSLWTGFWWSLWAKLLKPSHFIH